MTPPADTSSESPTQPVITTYSTLPVLDACLSFIVHLMKNKDKRYIADATVKSFDLTFIKSARELVFKYAHPGDKYSYRGLNQSKPLRERALHAFESLFTKLCELDAYDKMPVVACPSDQLHLLPSVDNIIDTQRIDDRFDSIENNLDWLKSQMESLKFLQSVSSIPPKTRERLDSGRSAKRLKPDDEDEDDYHSAAESSVSGMEVEEDTFIQPKYNLRKADRREKQSTPDSSKSSASYANMAKKNPVSKPRKPPVWGKSAESSELLCGSPPDIFLSHCRRSIEEDNVKEYLTGKGIDIVKVTKTSHAEAYWHSFRVAVNKYADFKKILSGEIIPPEVAVRQYYMAKSHKFNQSSNMNDPRIAASELRDKRSDSLPAISTVNVTAHPATVINQSISSIESIPSSIRV